MPLYKAYGDLAMDALRDDPYLLTEDYFGAAFAAVDQLRCIRGSRQRIFGVYRRLPCIPCGIILETAIHFFRRRSSVLPRPL